MRVALIADIHGNLIALDAVLSELSRQAIDCLVCLGDIAADGPRPREVIQRLRDAGAVAIMGNADAFILEPIAAAATASATRPDAPWTIPVNRWIQTQLTERDRQFLQDLPQAMDIELGGVWKLSCYHGSPRSWSENILPVTPAEQLAHWLAETPASICAGGHTHEPLLRQLGRQMIVNPGSVGAAFDRRRLPGEFRILPWADYATIDTGGSYPTVSFQRVSIDLDLLEADARASGMPCVDDWIGMWRW